MLKHPPWLVIIPLGEMGKPRQGLNRHQSPREQEGSMAIKSLGLGLPGPWIPILALPLIGDALGFSVLIFEMGYRTREG